MKRRRKATWLGAAILLLALFPVSQAAGQIVCGLRSDIISQLNNRHEEFQRVEALGTKGQLVEVFVSAGGSWSILVTQPATPNIVCFAAAGTAWQDINASGKPHL